MLGSILVACITCRGFFIVSVCRFVAGVIAREKVPAFERILWRACRGNVFLRYTEIETALEDPHTVMLDTLRCINYAV